MLTESEELELLELEEMDYQDSLQPSQQEEVGFFESLLPEIPQMAGGIGGAIAGAQRGFAMAPPVAPVVGPMSKPIGAAVGGVIGAFGGGGAGEAALQAGQKYVGSPNAPKTTQEALTRIAYAGGEEAMWEAGGRGVASIFGRAFKALRPAGMKGIDNLSNVFEKYGGHFTAAQRTESWLIKQMDGLTRGSLTGSGSMKSADAFNDQALLKMQENLSTQIAGTATKNLTPTEIGELVVNTINDGKAAFNTQVGGMYNQFDDMVVTKIATKRVTEESASPLLDVSGRPFITKIVKEIQQEVRPVNMSSVIEGVQTLAVDIERATKGLALSKEVGTDVISALRKTDKAMKFGDAQMLRSTLLDIQRGISTNPREAKLSGNIGRIVDGITKAMDTAAESAGELEKYLRIKNYASKGFKTFNDKFVSKIMSIAADGAIEKVGESLYQAGNVTNVLRLKKAMRVASSVSGTKSFDKAWGQVKQGYLEKIMSDSFGEVVARPGEAAVDFMNRAKVVSANKLTTVFQQGKKNNTMNAILNRQERESLFNFLKVSTRVQQGKEGGLGMVMQLAQAGAVISLLSGTGVSLGATATLFVGPRILAKLMTNPTTAKWLTKALTTPTANAKVSSGLMGQLAGAVARAEEELGMREQSPPAGVYEQ